MAIDADDQQALAMAAPTDAQMQAWLAQWFAAHPVPAGQNATDAQVAQAVAAYMAAHPVAPGKDGVSPVLTGGTVTTLPAGSQVTASFTGTTANPVLNLGIPVGDRGATGPSGVTILGQVTIARAGGVAIVAGLYTITGIAVTGLLTTDNILLQPVGALGAGYALHNAVCTAAGLMTVTMSVPVIALNAPISIPVRVAVLRP